MNQQAISTTSHFNLPPQPFPLASPLYCCNEQLTARSPNTYTVIVIRACAPWNGIAALVLNKSCHASDGHENSSRACIIRVRHDIKPGLQHGISNTGKISPRVKYTRNIECHDGMLDVEERTGEEGGRRWA